MSEQFASAILGHMIGDYLFQNDYVAREKKNSHLVCFLHAFSWTTCVYAFCNLGLIGFLVLLAVHFAQDRWGFVLWYMRKIGQSKFALPPCGPWSVIVVDNTFHALSIWLVLRLGL